jgi:MFS family permease
MRCLAQIIIVLFSLCWIAHYSDRAGRMPFILMSSAAYLGCTIWLYLSRPDDNHLLMYSGIGLGQGLGEAALITQMYAIISTFFEARAAQAFAIYKLFQAGATAISYFYHSSVSLDVKMIVNCSLLIISVFCFMILDRFVSSLSSSTKAQEEASPSSSSANDVHESLIHDQQHHSNGRSVNDTRS